MNVLMSVELLFGVVGLIWSMFMMYRNRQVHSYMVELLQEIREAAIVEIHLREHDACWRIDALRSSSYTDMLYKFWRPLDSWFPERDLLTNGNATEEEYRHARARQLSN